MVVFLEWLLSRSRHAGRGLIYVMRILQKVPQHMAERGGCVLAANMDGGALQLSSVPRDSSLAAWSNGLANCWSLSWNLKGGIWGKFKWSVCFLLIPHIVAARTLNSTGIFRSGPPTFGDKDGVLRVPRLPSPTQARLVMPPRNTHGRPGTEYFPSEGHRSN